MSQFARLEERCPHCRGPLYARPRVGPRITVATPVITRPTRDSKPLPPMAQVTIMCANKSCGYGREDSVPMDKVFAASAPPPASWWTRLRRALFGGD